MDRPTTPRSFVSPIPRKSTNFSGPDQIDCWPQQWIDYVLGISATDGDVPKHLEISRASRAGCMGSTPQQRIDYTQN